MVGSSKILTVSYGTFSCTLEGFDDSFGTMKAIAEYFRDLAADDRYFGAEPPVPDAEMLARIAEREVARRVEVLMEGKGVTLRMGDALPQPDMPEIAAAPPPVEPIATPAQIYPTPAADVRARPVMRQVIRPTEPEAVVQPAAPNMPPLMPVVAMAPIPAVQPMMTSPAQAVTPPPRVAPIQTPIRAPIQTKQPMPRPGDMQTAPVAAAPYVIPAHPDADSVAAKLQRIRAVVGRATIPVVQQEFAEDLGDIAAMPDDAAQPLSGPMLTQTLSAQWDDLQDLPDVALPADPALEPDLSDAHPAFDMASVAAALAEPAPMPEPEAEPASMAEAEPEQAEIHPPAPITPVRARVIRVRRADFDATAAPVGPMDPITADGRSDTSDIPADAATEDGFADLDSLQDLDGISDLIALDGAAEDYASDPADAPEPDAMLAGLGQSDLGDGTLPPDAEAALLEELAALERDADQTEALQGFAATDDEDLDLSEPSTFSMANVLAATATDDLAPATDNVATDSADDDHAETDHANDPDVSAALSDMAPDDATVAEDWSLPDAVQVLAEEAAPVAPVDPAPLRLGRDLLEREPEADAEAMERIMSQTDAELNSPENSRRREAISQLKAAVAATEAARMMGDKMVASDVDDAENAFRDDLKHVVRPRRPVGEVSADLRSERPRPAPLKLVASQRIDIPPPRPAPKPVMPVRPRRVSVQDDQDMASPVVTPLQAGSFAEFAASMGATQLPDLLEAAAAYTSFVEGVEDFSRPQLMKKVQDMAVEDYSREDGLRSFGTLLRQGRIMKTNNGRFVVSEESRFNPERKTA